MIEFCSRKRMVIVIISLVTVSVVSLGIETRWSTQQRIKGVQRKGRKDAVNETCKSGKESIVESCSECSAPELVKKAKFCEETGFREIVACEDGTKISRQCTVTPWMEEKKFWLFEGVTLVIGVLAYGMVVIRQHKLDQMLKEKIDRQIAAGI